MQRQEGLVSIHHFCSGSPCARFLPRDCRGPQHDELVERSRLSGASYTSGIAECNKPTAALQKGDSLRAWSFAVTNNNPL